MFSATARAGDDWKPLDPADLASKTPVVEKDADAEAIFWEVHLADEVDGGMPRTVLRHYLRIKIFTDRGRESQTRIDIPYLKNWSIKDIAARTIKSDGKIIELKKEDVFERTIVKSSGLKLKAKSFAMPGVEPGAIIEYRWKEVRNDRLANYIRLQFQREIPVQLVKYYIKPLSLPGFPYSMRGKAFGMEFKLTKEKDGYYSSTLTNMPAFHEEPRMPPEDSVRPWLLIYYSEQRNVSPDQFWKEFGKDTYETNKSRMKATDEVKQAAATAIGDASAPEQKLERLFEFCRAKIKNVFSDSSGLTAEDRDKFKENKSPADTLKHGMGTGKDIDLLFAALAIASGFEARVVRLGDRSDFFVDKSFPDDYFIQTYDIAVRVGEQWLFYDPASTYVPHGMLRWQEEGEDALLSDPKEPIWIKTPLSPPERSKQRRTAKLRLSEDGTLEGDVRIEYYGHFAVERKNFNDSDSQAQREENLRNLVKERMSTAELSEIKIENVTDPAKPFVYVYHVRVPAYAQRTGKRIFLQPAFFEHGAAPLFSASTRKNDVYFHYPWSEYDEVSIELPPGYALDNADAPAPFNAGKTSEYKPSIGVTTDGKFLIYKRSFFFGGGGSIFFPVAAYPQLKNYFDVLNKQDGHTITLKQSAASASN
jgi:Domain of Unknown Function with PDB structure (DUF3857)